MVFENYPFKAPKVTFKTQVYHPNVDEKGAICADVYENEWKPTKKIRMILEVLSSMMMSPKAEGALRGDIGA